jgi:trimeric autotransporter adhesin
LKRILFYSEGYFSKRILSFLKNDTCLGSEKLYTRILHLYYPPIRLLITQTTLYRNTDRFKNLFFSLNSQFQTYMSRILLLFGLLLSVMTTSLATTPLDVVCPTPIGLFASTRDSIAVLNWKTTGSSNGYVVQWKLRRDTEWKSADVTNTTLLIKNLLPCHEYEFRVKSICALGELSAYSEPAKFKTIGCVAPCSTPNTFGSETGDTKVFVKWAATGATKYEVQFREAAAGDAGWRTETVTLPIFSATNLKTCTKYQFRVRSICTNGTTAMNSEWSTITTMATTGCQVPCVAPRKLYYTLTNNAVVLKWDSIANATYELQLKGPNDTDWRTVSGLRTASYITSTLASCTMYQARVKVNCSNASGSEWSYIIRFKTGGCAAVCNKPEAMKFFVSDTVAIVTWVSTQASKYVFQYKLDSETAWKSINTTGNYYLLTGLLRCKKYNIRVQAVCSATSSSDYSNVINIETAGCQVECAMPKPMGAKIVDSVNAILSWTNVGARAYIVEFINLSNPTLVGRIDTVFTPALTVKNLARCSKYGFRVRAVCGSRLTAPTELFTFATEGCATVSCVTPINLKQTVVSDSIASLSWTGEAGSTYEILYTVVGVEEWKSVKVTTLEHRLISNRCKAYYWKVRKICSDNSVSAWSPIGKFETAGCPINNTCMVPALKVNLVSDSTFEAAWAGSGIKYELQYRLTTDSATAWQSVTYTQGVFGAKLALRMCKIYEFRMRAFCANGATSEWSTSIKAETRCVVANPCAMPTGLGAEIAADTSAFLFWTGSIVKYDLQYRIKGAATWTDVALNSAGYKLAGLRKCTNYEWRIRRYCTAAAGATSNSDWTASQYFTTKGCVEACIAPKNFLAKVDGTTAGIFWSDTYQRDTVIVEYRLSTDSSYSPNFLVGTTPNGVVIRGLVACKKYVVRAYRKCTDGSRSAVVETTFTAGGTCLQADTENNSTSRLKSTISTTSIYPNPGQAYVQVEYTLDTDAEVAVQLVNLQGQVVKQLAAGAQEAGNYMQVLDNMTDVNTGLYFIIIRTNGTVASTQKWMKQ